MKKIIKLSLLMPFIYLITGNVASAKNYEFVNADGSNKAEVCIASTNSKMAWEKKASELVIGEADLANFNCNGLSVEGFGQKYRNQQQSEDGVAVKVFAFTADTKKTAALLCVAASTSNKSLYKTMKEVNMTKNNMYLVRCNGMSIKRFAKKNGNKRYRI